MDPISKNYSMSKSGWGNGDRKLFWLLLLLLLLFWLLLLSLFIIIINELCIINKLIEWVIYVKKNRIQIILIDHQFTMSQEKESV